MPTDRPHVMVTCYDATFARLIAESNAVDSILVGDSLGMVVQGHTNTLQVTMDHMLYHVAAVQCGLESANGSRPLLIADMPVGSYQNPPQAVQEATRLIKVGADMVKVEGPVVEVVHALRKENIRVCGHIGLTPQTILDFRLQGKTEEDGLRLRAQAKALDCAGVELLVLEMIPRELAAQISAECSVRTIGIGSGSACGGQVLVIYDLLGFNPHFRPKFLKTYMNGALSVKQALETYAKEVERGLYPSVDHSYSAEKKS